MKVLQGECVEKIGLEIANTLDTDIQELVDETAAYRDNTVVGKYKNKSMRKNIIVLFFYDRIKL